jgi:hypothetical protein
LTFSETVADNIKAEIHNYVQWADRVICLGFSYANVNMALFPMPNTNQVRTRQVIGTCFEMSGPNQDYARAQLNRKFDFTQRAAIADVTCAKLFDDFDLQLA